MTTLNVGHALMLHRNQPQRREASRRQPIRFCVVPGGRVSSMRGSPRVTKSCFSLVGGSNDIGSRISLDITHRYSLNDDKPCCLSAGKSFQWFSLRYIERGNHRFVLINRLRVYTISSLVRETGIHVYQLSCGYFIG